mmetsp:Transcript_15102/g.30610  ORF Transcript_15102/g.30610 Transcript_15102/m.30610 type:complete len:86 (-) Transcript_15102:1008-1265(-)
MREPKSGRKVERDEETEENKVRWAIQDTSDACARERERNREREWSVLQANDESPEFVQRPDRCSETNPLGSRQGGGKNATVRRGG